MGKRIRYIKKIDEDGNPIIIRKEEDEYDWYRFLEDTRNEEDQNRRERNPEWINDEDEDVEKGNEENGEHGEDHNKKPRKEKNGQNSPEDDAKYREEFLRNTGKKKKEGSRNGRFDKVDRFNLHTTTYQEKWGKKDWIGSQTLSWGSSHRSFNQTILKGIFVMDAFTRASTIGDTIKKYQNDLDGTDHFKSGNSSNPSMFDLSTSDGINKLNQSADKEVQKLNGALMLHKETSRYALPNDKRKDFSEDSKKIKEIQKDMADIQLRRNDLLKEKSSRSRDTQIAQCDIDFKKRKSELNKLVNKNFLSLKYENGGMNSLVSLKDLKNDEKLSKYYEMAEQRLSGLKVMDKTINVNGRYVNEKCVSMFAINAMVQISQLEEEGKLISNRCAELDNSILGKQTLNDGEVIINRSTCEVIDGRVFTKTGEELSDVSQDIVNNLINDEAEWKALQSQNKDAENLIKSLESTSKDMQVVDGINADIGVRNDGFSNELGAKADARRENRRFSRKLERKAFKASQKGNLLFTNNLVRTVQTTSRRIKQAKDFKNDVSSFLANKSPSKFSAYSGRAGAQKTLNAVFKGKASSTGNAKLAKMQAKHNAKLKKGEEKKAGREVRRTRRTNRKEERRENNIFIRGRNAVRKRRSNVHSKLSNTKVGKLASKIQFRGIKKFGTKINTFTNKVNVVGNFKRQIKRKITKGLMKVLFKIISFIFSFISSAVSFIVSLIGSFITMFFPIILIVAGAVCILALISGWVKNTLTPNAKKISEDPAIILEYVESYREQETNIMNIINVYDGEVPVSEDTIGLFMLDKRIKNKHLLTANNQSLSEVIDDLANEVAYNGGSMESLGEKKYSENNKDKLIEMTPEIYDSVDINYVDGDGNETEYEISNARDVMALVDTIYLNHMEDFTVGEMKEYLSADLSDITTDGTGSGLSLFSATHTINYISGNSADDIYFHSTNASSGCVEGDCNCISSVVISWNETAEVNTTVTESVPYDYYEERTLDDSEAEKANVIKYTLTVKNDDIDAISKTELHSFSSKNINYLYYQLAYGDALRYIKKFNEYESDNIPEKYSLFYSSGVVPELTILNSDNEKTTYSISSSSYMQKTSTETVDGRLTVVYSNPVKDLKESIKMNGESVETDDKFLFLLWDNDNSRYNVFDETNTFIGTYSDELVSDGVNSYEVLYVMYNESIDAYCVPKVTAKSNGKVCTSTNAVYGLSVEFEYILKEKKTGYKNVDKVVSSDQKIQKSKTIYYCTGHIDLKATVEVNLLEDESNSIFDKIALMDDAAFPYKSDWSDESNRNIAISKSKSDFTYNASNYDGTVGNMYENEDGNLYFIINRIDSIKNDVEYYNTFLFANLKSGEQKDMDLYGYMFNVPESIDGFVNNKKTDALIDYIEENIYTPKEGTITVSFLANGDYEEEKLSQRSDNKKAVRGEREGDSFIDIVQ